MTTTAIYKLDGENLVINNATEGGPEKVSLKHGSLISSERNRR